MCCGEGSCCGPCCSLRSWFVTHVTFITLSAISCLLAASLLLGLTEALDLTKTVLDVRFINETEQDRVLREQAGDVVDVVGQYVTFFSTMLFISAALYVVWAVVGWVLVCGGVEKMYIPYVVGCILDACLSVGMIIGMFVFKESFENDPNNKENFMLKALAPDMQSIVGTTIRCAVMDVFPILCLLLKRQRVMDRYNGARPVSMVDNEMGKC